MRKICGVVISVAAAGLLAAHARALDTPTIPTPTLPSVPTPPVPVPPVPPVPALPTPPAPVPAPVPPPVPAPPKVTAPAPLPTPAPGPAPTPAATPSTPAAQASAQGSSSRLVSPPTYSPARASSGRTSPKPHRAAARRPVVTTFAVRKRALVRISVRELEPICRTVGKYRFAAQPGRNRLRLPKQIGKTRLGIGTYALVGETLLGRRIFAVVATLHRSKGRLLARVRRTSAGCAAHTFAVAGASLTMPGAASEQTADTSARRSSAPRSVFKPPTVETRHPHTSPFVRAATLNDAPMALRPLLYGLLAISIGLLAAAAMPNTVLPAGAAAAFVTSKRAYLAAAGIWLLVVVAVIAAAA